jgi:hypothetical protein
MGDIDDGHRVDVIVDAVDDPVGAAARAVPVLQRGAKPLADAVGLFSSGPVMNSYAAVATAFGRFSVNSRRAVGVIARS